MYSTPEQKKNCSLGFSYIPYANAFLVTSDISKNIIDRVFLSTSGAKRVENLCAQQTSCDHTTCEYKQEIIRALEATTCVCYPKKPSVDTQK